MKQFSIKFKVLAIIPVLFVFALPYLSLSDGSPLISSETDIVCSGNVTMNQAYNFPAVGSATNYNDSLNAYGSANTVFIKSFSSSPNSNNGVEVERFLLYGSDPSSSASILSSKENVGVSTASNSSLVTTAGNSLVSNGVFTHSETNTNTIEGAQLYHANLAEGKGTATSSVYAQLNNDTTLMNNQSENGLTGSTNAATLSKNLSVSSSPMYQNSSFFLNQAFLVGGKAPFGRMP